MSSSWTADQMADLTDKTFVVTGANSGIGFEASEHFAKKGARVILACRNQEKGARAVADIEAEVDGADVELMELDLASLESVHAFADAFLEQEERLDALVNNAGVMAIPRRETEDGFEMQLGTNHLGHFTLTARLLDLMARTGDARVVNVSSQAHRMGKIRFDDLHGRRKYDKWKAYGQSKLANLLFTFELDRRLRAARLPVRSMACHPGWSSTNLQMVGPQMANNTIMEKLSALGNKFIAQSAHQGALPTMYAATHPRVEGGDYIGPDGFMEMRGYPQKTSTTKAARDRLTAAQLWDVSEQLTGADYSILESEGSEQAA